MSGGPHVPRGAPFHQVPAIRPTVFVFTAGCSCSAKSASQWEPHRSYMAGPGRASGLRMHRYRGLRFEFRLLEFLPSTSGLPASAMLRHAPPSYSPAGRANPHLALRCGPWPDTFAHETHVSRLALPAPAAVHLALARSLPGGTLGLKPWRVRPSRPSVPRQRPEGVFDFLISGSLLKKTLVLPEPSTRIPVTADSTNCERAVAYDHLTSHLISLLSSLQKQTA